MKYLNIEMENLKVVAVDKFQFKRFWYEEKCFSRIWFPRINHFSVQLVTLDYEELEIMFNLSKKKMKNMFHG